MSEPAPALILKFDDSSTPSAADAVRQLSHELRQPLSTIESIAYYLEMRLPATDGKTREQLDKIPALIEQMNWMLSDAMHFFRAVPNDPQVVDLHELISQAVAEKNSIEPPHFHLEFPDEPALVRLDGAQGRHLMRSITAMLRQLGKPLETIVIRSRVTAYEVSLEFLLPGLEMSKETLHGLFEPFNPCLPAGSTLALASAKRIVEAHGGRISAKSDLGSGTSLLGAFPLAM